MGGMAWSRETLSPPYIRRVRNALSCGDFSALPLEPPVQDPFYHKEKRKKPARMLDADAWLGDHARRQARLLLPHPIVCPLKQSPGGVQRVLGHREEQG